MKRSLSKRSCICLLVSLVILGNTGGQVFALPPTDAGALIKQVDEQRRKVQKENELSTPQVPAVTPEAPAQDQVKITVNSFRFKGNTLLSDKQLAVVVRRHLHRSLTYTQLQDVAAAVGEAYRKRGWTVRVFLPKQDIVNGIVEIDIIEARFGKILLEKGSYAWPSQAKINGMFHAQRDEILDMNKLERSLMLLNDLPGGSASGRLQQGERDGETDLVVKTEKGPWVSGALLADNEGSRSTSEYRVHHFLQLLNPFKTGDITSLYVLDSEGLRFARFEETVPVGDDGWRVGANTSVSAYHILPSEFESLNAKGRSNSVGAQASYPLIRSRQTNLNFDLNYDHNFFYNRALDEVSSKYETDKGMVALRGNKADAFAGGGNSSADVNFVFGKQSLGTLNSGEDPALQGGYQKVTYNFSRQQAVLSQLSLFGAVSGQASPDKKLDSSEKFYLGGPDGVRAYPVSEGGGVQGILYKAELRWKFLPGYQLSGFYDHGHVGNAGSVQSYSLDGAGTELLWQLKSGLSMKFTWAHRLHDNPNQAANGDDQDGSLKKDRFWLSMILKF